jgi:FkbM family methyltransferase
LKDVRHIYDMGAYTGYVSAYLLLAHPHARLIAWEPHPDNFNILSHNLSILTAHTTYPPKALKRGVTSQKALGRVVDGVYPRVGLWSQRVVHSASGEAVCDSVGDLVVAHHLTYPDEPLDILKMDIEGSELEIFSKPCPWLKYVRCLVVEPHDDYGPATKVVVEQMEAHGMNYFRRNESLYGIRTEELTNGNYPVSI